MLDANAISAVGSGLTLPFLLVYLHGIRGIPLAIAGLAVSIIASGSVAGNLAGGTLNDRLEVRNALVLGAGDRRRGRRRWPSSLRRGVDEARRITIWQTTTFVRGSLRRSVGRPPRNPPPGV